MGVVYRAYDRRLKRTVAVKFIDPKLSLDDRFRERFLRETELAASFEHPNAVPIHDAGEVDGRLYLTMRYVEGSDLGELLRSEGPLEPARAIRICEQVARALDAGHASGLVHRDVKPSNVLLDEGEHVYLADFGLTRRLADDGNPLLDGSSLGTPAYVAPEQLEGGPVDGRADLYSLACLLYECLTGEPPFRGETRLGVAWAHLEEEPPSASARNATLPAAVDDVLRTGLAKDPADRQPTCAALIASAENALGLRMPGRSRRRTVLIAATAAVLAALAAILMAIFGRSDDAAADAPLFGRPGSVVRIDPETNAATDVVSVGRDPQAAAAHGGRVWIYNNSDDTVASVDEETKRVQTTGVPVRPLDLSAYAGPVLAADAGGAWLIGRNWAGHSALVRIAGPGLKSTFHPLDVEPRGVATGYGSVWVVAHGERDSQLLRIDSTTGRIRHRTRFRGAAAVDSVAVGLGYVWVVAASSSTLYRIDHRTGRVRGEIRANSSRGPRPRLMRGFVWVGLDLFNPRRLALTGGVGCCPATAGEDVGGFGSLWTTDAPTGTVIRWGMDWNADQIIRAVEAAPTVLGACLTSIAAGVNGIWVTVAPASSTGSCGP